MPSGQEEVRFFEGDPHTGGQEGGRKEGEKASGTPGKKRGEGAEKAHNAEYRYRRAQDSYKKEVALRTYRGWSKQELITDAEDYGIRDERRDYRKMSREQLAVWLYSHQHRQKGMT